MSNKPSPSINATSSPLISNVGVSSNTINCREATNAFSEDFRAQYALAQAIDCLSYFMKKNTQTLRSASGSLSHNHQNLAWVPVANTLNYHPQVNLCSRFPQANDLFGSIPSSPIGQSNIGGQMKSEVIYSETPRPKSAMRGPSPTKRARRLRRSVSFSSPVVVSVDGELYPPLRRYGENPMGDIDNSWIPDTVSSKDIFLGHDRKTDDDQSRLVEHQYRVTQRNSERTQTPGPSKIENDFGHQCAVPSYSEGSSFRI